jgi:hypothetical protein
MLFSKDIFCREHISNPINIRGYAKATDKVSRDLTALRLLPPPLPILVLREDMIEFEGPGIVRWDVPGSRIGLNCVWSFVDCLREVAVRTSLTPVVRERAVLREAEIQE